MEAEGLVGRNIALEGEMLGNSTIREAKLVLPFQEPTVHPTDCDVFRVAPDEFRIAAGLEKAAAAQ